MRRRLDPSIGGAIGAVLLAVGAILPPTRTAVVDIDGTATLAVDPAWTNVGLMRFEMVLVGILVLWISRQQFRTILRSTASVLAGLGGGWVCFDALQHSVHTPTVEVLYAPALGMYLLAAGSALLVSVGAIGLSETFDLPWVTLLGSIGLLVGSYLPWLRVGPTVEPPLYVPLIVQPNGMTAGIGGFDFLLLGGVVPVLAIGRFSARRWPAAIATILVGAATLSVCRWYLPESDVLREAGYILAAGWNVTVTSGCALVVGGLWDMLDTTTNVRDAIRDLVTAPSRN